MITHQILEDEGIAIVEPSGPLSEEDFAGLSHHIRFVRNHHRMIRRVALVSDSLVASIAPRLATHFVSAEVKSFDDDQTALEWLRSEG